MCDITDINNIFVREFEKVNGDVLKINQCETGDVGCVVWDAALVLCYFIETGNLSQFHGKPLKDCSIVELGAGTGIVGIELATFGSNVVITDLEEFLPLMRMNVNENERLLNGKAEVKILKWGEPTTINSPDLVFLADCIYYDQSLEPLVSTIKDLCRADTSVICCYERRTTGNKPQLESKFLQLMDESFINEVVPHKYHHDVFSSPDIHILKFTSR